MCWSQFEQQRRPRSCGPNTWLHHYLPLPVSPQPPFYWCTKHYFDQTSSSSSHLTRVLPSLLATWEHMRNTSVRADKYIQCNDRDCNGTDQCPRESIKTAFHAERLFWLAGMLLLWEKKCSTCWNKIASPRATPGNFSAGIHELQPNTHLDWLLTD